MRDGLPICLGYLSVAFTFGMVVVEGGLPPWVAVLISMTCFTGTGQFAGIALIVSGGMYVEMLVTTFIINIRYLLMSLSLSQKIEKRMNGIERALLSFGNTDEVFAVAMQQEGKVGARYLSGLMLTPYLGWTLGTLLGATVTGFLPFAIRSALGIAIYVYFHYYSSCTKNEIHCNRHPHFGCNQLFVLLDACFKSIVQRLGHYHLCSGGVGICSLEISN